MSTLGAWKLACQWASGKVEECQNSGNAAVGANCTVVAGTNMTSGTTGFAAVGSNCLQYEVTSGAAGGYGLIATQGKALSVAGPTVTGFFWRPKTNPSGGTYSRLGIFKYDAGAGGGFSLTWEAGKTLAIWDTYNFTEFYQTGVSPDTAESYGGITNPPYFRAIRAVDGTIGIRIYKWKNDTTTWTLMEQWESSLYTSSPGATQYIDFGSFNLGSPTGAWYLANLFIIKGGGLWGPIGCSMASGTVDGTLLPVTNHVSWQASSAGEYSGTIDSGTTTTLTDTGAFPASPAIVGYEITYNTVNRIKVITSHTVDTLTFSAGTAPVAGEAYKVNIQSNNIDEVAPDDTDYLYNSGSGISNQQWHAFTDSIITGSPNVHAVQVSGRFYVEAGSQSTQSIHMRISGGTNLSAGHRTVTLGTTTWGHDYLCSQIDAGGGEWTQTDVDGLEIGWQGAAQSSPYGLRISHAMVTVAYGTAETLTTTRAAQTQVN